MDELTGRRVLVTGASSGIGEATARAFAAAGARVACLARRSDRIAALAGEIGGVAVTADVADVTAARRGVDEAAAALGGLDVLVNNAGVLFAGSVEHGDPAQWRTMLEVNVLGLLLVSQAAIGHLRRSERADLVILGSMTGRRVPPSPSGVYSATKHAVHALAHALRRELQPDRVRVSLVAPGLVRTEILDQITDDDARSEYQRRMDELAMPPEAIAAAILHAVGQPRNVNLFEVAVVSTDQQA